jgi:syntaxin 7
MNTYPCKRAQYSSDNFSRYHSKIKYRKHGRLASQDAEPESHELSETRSQFQQQQQLQIQQQLQKSPQRQADGEEVIPDYELDYQEALIEERENEIREIEVGINELNQIFRDLGTIVQEQGGNIGTFILVTNSRLF